MRVEQAFQTCVKGGYRDWALAPPRDREGHDFSRAAKIPQRRRALAPEELFSIQPCAPWRPSHTASSDVEERRLSAA